MHVCRCNRHAEGVIAAKLVCRSIQEQSRCLGGYISRAGVQEEQQQSRGYSGGTGTGVQWGYSSKKDVQEGTVGELMWRVYSDGVQW